MGPGPAAHNEQTNTKKYHTQPAPTPSVARAFGVLHTAWLNWPKIFDEGNSMEFFSRPFAKLTLFGEFNKMEETKKPQISRFFPPP